MKELSRKSIKIFIGLLVLLSFGLAIVFIFHNPFAKSSSQADYPELYAPAFGITVDLTFPEYVANAELIVDATVAEVLPEKTVTFVPEEGSPEQKEQEKWGTGDYVYKHLPIKLNVNDVWAGNLETSSVTFYITPLMADSVPDFKPGDRMVFFLATLNDGYGPSTTKGSLYYVASDDKIYPTLLSDTLKDYSGKKLGDFKRDVQEAWEQKQNPSEP